MDWSAVVAELPKAVPVIVGGILAIAGGIAGQSLTHIVSVRRERKKLIREKAEALIAALYEHRDWVGRENSRLVFGSELPEMPSPLDKAYAIQELYFPELAGSLRNITASMKDIVPYFYKHAKARLADKAAWINTFDSEEFSPLYQAYLNAFQVAVNDVVRVARKHIET